MVEVGFDKSISDGVNIGSECFRGYANRLPALHSLGGGGREYKAVYVQNHTEIGLFSDEVVVNRAP